MRRLLNLVWLELDELELDGKFYRIRNAEFFYLGAGSIGYSYTAVSFRVKPDLPDSYTPNIL